MLVGNFTNLTNVLNAHETGAANANRIAFIAGFGNVNQDPGFENLVVEPLAVVLLDNGRKEFLVVPRSDICNPVL
jgi:hypothetical protein